MIARIQIPNINKILYIDHNGSWIGKKINNHFNTIEEVIALRYDDNNLSTISIFLSGNMAFIKNVEQEVIKIWLEEG